MKISLSIKVAFFICGGLGMAAAITDIETALHPGYDVMTIHPADFQPVVGGMDFLPDGRLLVLTWRGSLGPEKPFMDPYTNYGDLYIVSGVKGNDPSAIKVKKIADGFKDALGVLYVQGSIYVGDIDRLIKLVDKDGDGYYETKQTFATIPAYNAWFEFAFGPIFKDGKFYMSLCGPVVPGGSPQTAKGPGRSTVLSIDMQGKVTPFAGGFRAPNGITIGPGGDIFTTDNQGVWEPSSKLIHVQANHNYGYKIDPPDQFSNLPETAPAIWIPYGVINNSATEPTLMPTGLYKDQFFFGDVKRGGIRRMFLEKVKGIWQGAVFPFTGGTEAGVHRIRIDSSGVIYAGGLGRDVWENWNGKTFGLQKFSPNGKTIFEILAVRARKNGIELEFTQPVGTGAEQASQYKVEAAIMRPQNTYGGGNMQNTQSLTIKSVTIAPDRKRVYLAINGLTPDSLGRVVHITVPGLASQDGKPLWFNETWYTLNALSDSDPFAPDPVVPVIGRSAKSVGGLFLHSLAPGQYRLQAPFQPRGSLQVTNILGKTVFLGRMDAEGNCAIDASDWPRGIYSALVRGDASDARLTFTWAGAGK